MAKIIKEDEPFERVEMPRDKAIQLCEDLGQTLKVEHIDEGLADRGHGLVLSAGRVPRSVPRAACAQRRRDRGVQAALGGRRLLEGRRLAPAVAAALRHGLVQQARPGRAPQRGRRGQTPRPSRAGQAAGAVHDRSRRRLRAGPLAAQGGHHPPRAGELHLRRTDQARIPAGQHAGDRPRPSVRDLGPLSVLCRQPVPADRDGGRRALPAQADELPAPYQDLSSRSRGAIATCRCGWPSSARSIASSSRAS